MDSARFGQTQFQERLTFQRGLEGELTRSISSLAAVQAARVHLALPNQNGFFREQQKPGASVLLTLHPGRTLDRAQVAGIVHLVSSSVPEMSPKAVSVLDQSGALLTGSNDAAPQPADSMRSSSRTCSRSRTATPSASSTSSSRSSATTTCARASPPRSTSRRPRRPRRSSSRTRAKARASRSAASRRASSPATPATRSRAAFPGAASNQPPIAATAPLTGASQPLHAAATGAAGASGGRREAVTNYEVDKTVRVTKSATGNVKRLNAAVVVNNRSVTDAKGKTTQVPLGADEIEKITALVRESIGFSKERGDSVKVVNAPFKVEPAGTVGREAPFWKMPEVIDIVRAAAMPVGLAIVALLVFFGMVRPAVKTALAPRPAQLSRPGMRIDAVVDDEQTHPTPAIAAPPTTLRQIEGAKALAKDNPAAVAGIVRGWVGGGEAA
jgi:flagellar M-ring protein FliF